MVLKFFWLAATFLFISCADFERDNPEDQHSIKYVANQLTYDAVTIGTQVWMARNLNYNVSGSVCYNWNEAHCAIYGRLYDWATAMNLPDSCNSSSCASQVGTKHKGICPSGWHIPNYDDLTMLIDFVGSPTATKLKATSNWLLYNGIKGTDNYGFSALPGGYSISGGFDYVGEGGYWWSSDGLDDCAHALEIWYAQEDAEYGGPYKDKSFLYSVRCVKD